VLPDLHGAIPWRQSLSPLFGERHQNIPLRGIFVHG
jgi:hypothetical protein